MAMRITLRSSDGQAIEVDEAVARQMTIPLNVTGNILAKVIEYCTMHVEPANPDNNIYEADLRAWDADFVRVDKATLFELILAADYLNIRSLKDLTIQTAADMIKGKTPDELCKFFGKKNDVRTPEEEEKFRRENQWAFE